MTQTYILGQRGKCLELFAMGEWELLRVGGVFGVAPRSGTETESWTVVKVFSIDESKRIDALSTLISFETLASLFSTQLFETVSSQTAA